MENMTSAEEKRILIVEDCRDIQCLLSDLLESDGYAVSCASDGEEALNLIRNSDKTPDLILLDLMMPRMDGYEFRNIQERDPSMANIPVVIMTADGAVQRKAQKIHAHGYLKKPFVDVDSILSSVSRFFPNV